MTDCYRGRVSSGILQFLLTLFLCVQTGVVVKGGPGAFDPTFAPMVNGAVHCVLPLPDGRVVIGGDFTRVDNQVRNRIARLNSDGSLDTQFLSSGSGFSAAVRSIARQSDGKLVVGGDFLTVHQQSRRGLVRLNPDGTLDGTFAFQGTTAPVLSVLIQPDGRILCGGSFLSIAGVEQRYVARIHPNGTFDSSFNTAAAIDGTVNSIALQPDGKVLIGGAFTRVFGLQRNRIARLNDNGSLDQSFLNGLAGPLATVRKASWLPPENIMIAGDFTTVNGVQRARIAKLMTNGVLETTFNPNRPGGPAGAIHSLALSADGSVFIAGDFISVNSSNRTRIAKLHADGTLNGSFGERLPGADLGVRDVALDPSGKLIVGGLFTRINGPSTPYIARLYDDFYPPEITRHPESRNVVVGTNILLNVLARNSTPLTYQWSKNGVEIPGATSTSYSLFNVQENDSGIYSVTLRNELGATTSSNAVIRVGYPPVIVDQPEGALVNAGDPVEFTVNATGSTLNYAWFKGAGRISGANEATFNIASTTLADAGSYRVRVTNFFGASTSSIVQLTVNSPPRIHTEPADQEVEVGSPLLLTVEASGFPQIGYQWSKNDTLLAGATEATYASTNAALSDSGAYFLVVTNALGSITSRVAQVSVFIRPPTLTSQSQSGNIRVGEQLELTGAVSGTPPLDWQWFKDGLRLAEEATSLFSISEVSTNDSGVYSFVVTNVAGAVTSAPIVINIGIAPVITLQPLSTTNKTGDTVTFSVDAEGTEPLLFQWFRSGVLLNGETNRTIALTNLTERMAGSYRVRVQNPFGRADSSVANLRIAGLNAFLYEDLVAYYPFDGNAIDASGNEHNGVVTGATPNSDRFGAAESAFYFDGNGVIDIADAPALNFSQQSPLTISVWVKRETDEFPMHILGKRGVDCANYQIGVGNTGGNLLYFGCGILPYQLHTPSPLPVNVWTHLLIVFDGETNSFFVNGELVSSEFSILNPPVPEPLKIGGSGPFEKWKGYIDEVRIYRRAFTTGEARSLYRIEIDAPEIISHPSSAATVQGESVQFRVTASSTIPVSFTWMKDGFVLAGETSSTLTITNVQPLDIGYYAVAVSNGVAGTISSNASLSLNYFSFEQWAGLSGYFPLDGDLKNKTRVTNDLSLVRGTEAYSTNRFNIPGSSAFFDFTELRTANSLGLPKGSQDFTITLWARLDERVGYREGTTDPDPHRVFFANQDMDGLQLGLYDMEAGDPIPELYVGGSAAFGVPANTPRIQLPKLHWHHVTIARNKDVQTLFFNGSPVLRGTNTFPVAHDQVQGRLSFGRRNNGDHAWTGQLDDIRIYSRALSESDIADLFDSEAAIASLSAEISGGKVQLKLRGSLNAELSILQSTNLNTGWTLYGKVPVTVTNISILEITTSEVQERFFRAVLQP